MNTGIGWLVSASAYWDLYSDQDLFVF